MLIFSTIDQNQRLNCSSLSAFSPASEAKKYLLTKCVKRKHLISEFTQQLQKQIPPEQLTRLVIEGGETDEHLDVDFPTAVDQQPEVLCSQVLQGIFREYIQ